jgi:hypothetical protein
MAASRTPTITDPSLADTSSGDDKVGRGSDSLPASPQHDEIAILAYSYWEADGYPDGFDLDHWFRAEQTLRGMEIAPDPAASRDRLQL